MLGQPQCAEAGPLQRGYLIKWVLVVEVSAPCSAGELPSRPVHSGVPARRRATQSAEVMARSYRYATPARTAFVHPEPRSGRLGRMVGDDDERQASPRARQAGCA